MIQFSGAFLILLGGLTLAIACWGVLRLPDALSRQHAATKAATLALGMIACGGALIHGGAEWWGRVLILLTLLAFTLPLASHALARAALERQAVGDNESGTD